MCSVATLCLTLCSPIDCRLPGSSVHGILQARILQWVAIPFSRVSSLSRDRTNVSWIADGFLTCEPTRKPNLDRFLKVKFNLKFSCSESPFLSHVLFIKHINTDFPRGLVIKTLLLIQGHGFNHPAGNEDSTYHSIRQKQKQKQKNTHTQA